MNKRCKHLPIGWFVDTERMVVIREEFGDIHGLELPAEFVVCWNCQGKGTHVNRAIDEHGISQEEFAEDPDFAEAYFRGDFDVLCDYCHGNRVLLMPIDKCEELEKDYEEDRLFASEKEAERRMGA